VLVYVLTNAERHTHVGHLSLVFFYLSHSFFSSLTASTYFFICFMVFVLLSLSPWLLRKAAKLSFGPRKAVITLLCFSS